jgi:hypothetical protein
MARQVLGIESESTQTSLILALTPTSLAKLSNRFLI